MKKRLYIYNLILILLFSAGFLWAGIGVIDIASPLVITNSGHYRLSRNISVIAGNAIDVKANDVTIDLNGYTVASSFLAFGSTNPPCAIFQESGYKRLSVKNGTLTGGSGHGIYAQNSSVQLDSVTISGCADDPVVVGNYADIENCILYSNVTSYSSTVIFAGHSATIRNCNILWNEGSSISLILAGAGAKIDGIIISYNKATSTYLSGIHAGAGSSIKNCVLRKNISNNKMDIIMGSGAGVKVENCIVESNNTTASTFSGISLKYGGAVELCSVFNNGTSTGTNVYGCNVNGPATISEVTVVSNLSNTASGYGIWAGTTVVVRASAAYDQNYTGFYGGKMSSFKYCLAAGNHYMGFRLYSKSSATRSLAYYNGRLAPAGQEGGFVTGLGGNNRIIDNHSVQNWRGIVINGVDNLIKGNSLYNQSINIKTNNTGNTIGEFIPAGNLDDEFTTDNPWANFGL